MKKVFVSGSFNVLHAGHLQFFREARALGDSLVVSFPPADLLWNVYGKKSVLEDVDKMELLSSLEKKYPGLRYRIFGAIQRGEIDGFHMPRTGRMPAQKDYEQEE